MAGTLLIIRNLSKPTQFMETYCFLMKLLLRGMGARETFYSLLVRALSLFEKALVQVPAPPGFRVISNKKKVALNEARQRPNPLGYSRIRTFQYKKITFWFNSKAEQN